MVIDYKGGKVKLPDFLIVGAAKSGTTSLHYYLGQHPQIFMPKVKESFFFSFLDSQIDLTNRIEWKELTIVFSMDDYISYFKDAGDGKIIGEACPVYLYTYRDTIRNIKKVYKDRYKDLKIIMILRNPAERAWSNYLMHKRDGREHLKDFRVVLYPEVVDKRLKHPLDSIAYDYIGAGRYYEQVNSFMKEFPNVKVFLYEDFLRDTLAVVKEIFDFLGADNGFIPDIKMKYNVSGETKSKFLHAMVSKQYFFKNLLKRFIPYHTRQVIRNKIFEKIMIKKDMPDDIRKELITKYFKDDILNLEALINKDLTKWLA